MSLCRVMAQRYLHRTISPGPAIFCRRCMIAGRPLPDIRQRVRMDDFRDLGGLDRYLDINIVTMYDFLYRYREPNERISELEAVSCIENSSACRTSD
jgi:hypothetical protein